MGLEILRAKLSEIYPIPDEEWEKFTKLVTPKRMDKKDYFVKAGETSYEMGFIISGMVRYYLINHDGQEVVQFFREEGNIMMVSFTCLSDEPSPIYIEAIEETTYLSLSFKDFSPFYEQHICWTQIGKRFAEDVVLLKTKREIELLMLDGKERYLKFKAEQPDLFSRVSQRNLALYLGLNPSALSRIVKKIKEDEENDL